MPAGARGGDLKGWVCVTFVCLSACGGFGSRKLAPPQPTEIIVTGAPTGSIMFVDGLQAGPAASLDDHPQILNVAAGYHQVDIHMGDAVVYREDAYVRAGERRMVRVLSGFTH